MEQTQVSTEVRCAECGASRPAAIARTVPRPPCPGCGAGGIAVQIGIAEEINLAASVSFALSPAYQELDWKGRWTEIQAMLKRLLAPRTDECSGNAIKTGKFEVLSFYVHAYHVKDALKLEPASLGLTEQEIEDAITNTPALALLADLANLTKHGGLNRVRSGSAPCIGNAQGVRSGSGDRWRIELEVEHKGQILDGLTVAQDAVHAWDRQLQAWGLARDDTII